MINQRNTYNAHEPLISFKNLIVFCLIMTLLSKPFVSIPMDIMETKYELLDSQEKENSSEKEIVLEFEDEHTNFYFFYKNSYDTYLMKLLSHYLTHLSLLNFSPDISLPPPKV